MQNKTHDIKYTLHIIYTIDSSQYKMKNKNTNSFAVLEVGQGKIEEGLISFGSWVGHWIF